LLTPSPGMPVTGNTELTRPENRAFFPALDGLRAMAFLMVFFQHYYALPWGWTGVNIFFVLSGFLITGILFDSRDDAHRARNFYVRRTLRIFPLYYGIFLALLLLWPILHWQWTAAWLAWPLYLANYLRLVHGAAIPNSALNLAANAWLTTPLLPRTQIYLGHFWSLCVEEQFYLVWPWVVFWVRGRRALLWICALSVVIVPLLRLLAQHTAPAWMVQGSMFNATPFQLDSLLLGGLLALLWRGPQRARLLTVGRVCAVLFAVVTAAFLAHSIDPQGLPTWREAYRYPHWQPTFGISFVDCFAAALVLCCISPAGWVVRLFILRPLRWLGRVSYGAYVFHDLFHDLYVHTAVAMGRHSALCAAHIPGISITFGLATTLLFSWLSFRYFESPFLNLKERWTLRTPSADQPREAAAL
jgi:peptidoglycan/LPS O-acetylase OafA/YrhL